LLVAAVTCAIEIRDNGFVAIYTDPSGYVSAGARWLSGEIQKPVHFQFQPTFPNADTMGSPLGYRPGAIKGTDVGEYPLGLPVFLAACMALGGELGAYVFGPVMAGVLALATYGVGAAIGAPWGGVIAAILISASPVTVRHSLYVSSDVPATAFWVLAWLMSLRSGAGAAVAAGASVAAAVMIRPNTAPLAVVIGLVVLLGGVEPAVSWRRPRWAGPLVFALFAAIGPTLVMWSNTMLFGGPLEPGYKGAAEFWRWGHVGPNLQRYPGWLFQIHSRAALLGLAAVPLAFVDRLVAGRRRAIVFAISGLAIVVVNFASILPYLNFEQWTYLRFVLPAMAALFVLLGALIVWLARLLRRSRWTMALTPVLLAPAVLIVWTGEPEVQAVLREPVATRSVLLMGGYLRTALPSNAVLMVYTHSGSAGYYANRPVVRLDLLVPELDSIIVKLQAHGFRPYLLIDEVSEAPYMHRTYPQSAYWELDWAPRATFSAFGRIWLLDPADRAPFLAGTRYPSDMLR
jgi:MFS family permease